MEKLNQFKIRVTPQQSEDVQKTIFNLGSTWSDGSTQISFLQNAFLFLNRNCLSYMPITCFGNFTQHHFTEISYEDFKEMYNV